jgi:hypothetical protein
MKSYVTLYGKVVDNMYKDLKKNKSKKKGTPSKLDVYANTFNKKYNKIQKDIDAYTLKYGKDSKGAREIKKAGTNIKKQFSKKYSKKIQTL